MRQWLVTGVCAALGMTVALVAAPTAPSIADEVDEEVVSITLSFTEGPGKFRVDEIYLCAEDCFRHPKDPEAAHNVNHRKVVASSSKADSEGVWTVEAPPGEYSVGMRYVDPNRRSRTGFIAAAEATPRVTFDLDESLRTTVADADVDLGPFTLFGPKDIEVPGKLSYGSYNVLGDEYFFTQMTMRRLPPKTRAVTTYETCKGATRTVKGRASKKGRLSYVLEATISQIAREFSWTTTLSHRKYTDRVLGGGLTFPKRYKAGC